VTIGLGESTFLLVVIDDHASISHGYEDMGLQKFGGHEFDLLGARDVIGHVTIGLDICGFLLVVHCNHASILHRYGDMVAIFIISCQNPVYDAKILRISFTQAEL